MVTQEKFISLTSIVIDNFEGGYYHPAMLKNFKPSDQAILKYSGETMFGLDRMAGSQLAKYPEWKTFWDILDTDKKENLFAWKYQYRGGKVGLKLKELAGKIMFQWFNYLSKKYILLGSMDEIANDDRLIIHFSYGSWNGEGWFIKYADALNNAILKYEGNREMIFQTAIKARTEAVNKWGLPNKVIRQQGKNMMALFVRMAMIYLFTPSKK